MGRLIMKTLLALAAFIFALTATAQTHGAKIKLTWQDNSDNEEAFEIQRQGPGDLDFGVIATVPANVVLYIDAAVDIGIEYVYRVRAANSGAYSGFTNTANGIAKIGPADPTGAATESKPALKIITNAETGGVTITPILQP